MKARFLSVWLLTTGICPGGDLIAQTELEAIYTGDHVVCGDNHPAVACSKKNVQDGYVIAAPHGAYYHLLAIEHSGGLEWSKVVTSPADWGMARVLDIQTFDNDDILVGMLTSQVVPPYHQGYAAQRFTAFGDLIWTRFVDVVSPVNSSNVDQASFVIGEDDRILFNHPSEDGLRAVALDGDGNALWSVQLQSQGPLVSSSAAIAVSDAGQVLLAGRMGPYVHVAKLDMDGGVLWNFHYSTGHYNQVTDAKALANGNFLVAGYDDDKACALELDQDGAVVWFRRYDPPEGFPGSIFEQVEELDNGELLFHEGSGNWATLTRTDADGEVVGTCASQFYPINRKPWSYLFGHEGGMALFSLVLWSQVLEPDPLDPVRNPGIVRTPVDAPLPCWFEPSSSVSTLSGISAWPEPVQAVTVPGALALAFTVAPYALDPASFCDMMTDVPESVAPTHISIGPDPVSEELHLLGLEDFGRGVILVRDLVGRVVLACSDQRELDVRSFDAGTYVLVRILNSTSSTARFVKE